MSDTYALIVTKDWMGSIGHRISRLYFNLTEAQEEAKKLARQKIRDVHIIKIVGTAKVNLPITIEMENK